MSTLRIGLLGGDGIGPEVVEAAAPVLQALVPHVETVSLDVGFGCFEREGTALPDATVAALETCQGALLGAVGSPLHRVEGYKSPVVALRRHFDLYANLRPLATADGSIDLTVVRENTEGLYSGIERIEGTGADEVAVAERHISRRATERIARAALAAAEGRRLQGRRALLTVVHKANVLRVSDGLFREAVLGVAEEFPQIEVEEQLVDSMAYRLVLEPERYGVVVAPNLYGDVLSDLGAALVGGLGLVPSANVGESFVMAEPVHGSAPDIAGTGRANPLATLKALAMLLERLEEGVAGERLAQAALQVQRGGPRTPDRGGSASTTDVVDAVLEALERLSSPRDESTPSVS